MYIDSMWIHVSQYIIEVMLTLPVSMENSALCDYMHLGDA